MSPLLLFLAPLVTAHGVNIGNVYDRCTGEAAVAELWSGTPETIADHALAKCRYLEPQLKEGLDRMWRTDRSGNVAPATDISRLMTAESWERLLAAKRSRLISDIGRLREELRK